MTNVGKSSFLNELSIHLEEHTNPVIISDMPNTTLSFINWKIKDWTIIDAPGFNYQESLTKELSFKAISKKYVKPRTIQTKEETRIWLENIFSISSDLEKNSITFYGNNELQLEKKYKDMPNSKKIKIKIPQKTDLVLPGIGFFYIRHTCTILLEMKSNITYEVRPSLFGGCNDIN